MLQATFGQTTPEERVLRTRSALRAFTEDDIRQPLRVVPVIRYGQPGRLFLMNGKPVLLLSQADLDEGDDLTLDQAAQRVLARMEAQRTSLQEQFNNRYLFISAGKALAGALLLALFYYGAFRAWRRVRRFFLLRILEKRSAIPQHWRRYLGNIEVRLYAVLVILLGMLACYLWLSWAFSLFPWTRVWERIAGRLVAGGDPPPLSVDCRLPAGADDRGAYFPSHLAYHSPGEGGSRPGRRRPHSGSRHSSGDR
ncbi:transporter small conductance mechanosensitive ion channel (MscS) family [Klebsiella pneumoniae]|nr:transporter small conductance mechanosensitive ion channel (MscS) family [Klebsiella pneumoniae]